jgi:hypothetical protein
MPTRRPIVGIIYISAANSHRLEAEVVFLVAKNFVGIGISVRKFGSVVYF